MNDPTPEYDPDVTLPPPQPIGSGDGGPAVSSPPGYEIVRELGRGGMGVVYLARQKGLNRVVALKMILAGGHTSAEDRARFLAEAEAVAAARHPGIVEVYDHGTHEGLPYFALEFCEGGSLAERMNGTPLPPGESARVVEQVARAMQLAHDRGIVHRDLKPANVLLSFSREPPASATADALAEGSRLNRCATKVTDFGLAKRVAGGAGVTRTGSILGTPAYMAPEQAEGKRDVGPPADVYALGAILYECLTGRPPFQAATALDTILQVIADEPVSLRRLNAKVPRDLETIALKCLEKLPGRRYASAGDLAEDLRCWQAGEPILARPAGAWERATKWAKRNPAVTALLVALSLALGLVAYFAGAARARAVNAEEWARLAETNEAEALQQADRAERELSRAEMLVYAGLIERAQRAIGDRNVEAARFALDECRWDLRGWEHRHLSALLRRDQVDWHAAEHTGKVAYSPDGRYLAGGESERKVRIWDAHTGRQVGAVDGLGAFAFAPDGRHLAVGIGTGAMAVVDVRTGLRRFAMPAHLYTVRSAAFSPDGQLLATAGGGHENGEVKVWDARNGRLVIDLPGHAGRATGVAFSHDGTRLVTTCRDERIRVWEVGTWRELRSWRGHDGIPTCVTFHPDGGTFATAGEDETIRVWEFATGRELAVLRGHVGIVTSAKYSHDGARIASGGTDRTVRLWDPRTSRELEALLGHGNPVNSVDFRLDGTRLASAGAEDRLKVWDVRQDRGVTPAWRSAGFEAMVMTPAGDRVATFTNDNILRVREAAGGRELFRLPDQGNNMAFSPDGERLVTSASGKGKIWDARTGRELLTLHRGHEGFWSFAFSPDGGVLATAGGPGGAPEPVKVWDARTGKLLHEMKGHTNQGIGIDFAPDGRRVASVGADRVAFVWDAREGKQLLRIEPASWKVAFSPDGSRLVGGGGDDTAKVWDAGTGRELLTLRGHTSGVMNVAWAPDGTRLATAAGDGTVRLWHAGTGHEVTTFRRPATNVWSVAFSADGTRLAGAGRSDGRLTQGKTGWLDLWDAPPWRQPLRLLGHPAALREASFTGSGDHVVARDENGKMVAWDARTGRLVNDFAGPFPDVRRAESGDGQYRLVVSDGAARLVPRGYAEPARMAPADPAWHRERADHFEQSGDVYAAVFHLDQMLAAFPAERPALLARRARLLADAPATDAFLFQRARGAVIAPSHDNERRRLLPAVSRLAEARGTALPRRVLAGLQFRAGESDLAIRSLKDALTMRPAGSPPIEELLLALAHAALGRSADARRLAAAPAATEDRLAPGDGFTRVEYALLLDEVQRVVGTPP